MAYLKTDSGLIEESKKAFPNDENFSFNNVHTNIYQRDNSDQDIEINDIDKAVAEYNKAPQNELSSSLNFYNRSPISDPFSDPSSNTMSITKVTNSTDKKAKLSHFNKIVAKVCTFDFQPLFSIESQKRKEKDDKAI